LVVAWNGYQNNPGIGRTDVVKSPVKTCWLGLFAFLTTIFIVLVLPRLLIVNRTMTSDYIAVLDGHDPNFCEGLRLLQSGVARRMFVCLDLPDVPLSDHEIQQDREFVRRTAGPLAESIDICKNDSEDALTELGDVVAGEELQRVLIVTPAPESRATYILAKRRYRNLSISAHASADPNFDVHWWRSRVWAETYFNSVIGLATAVMEPRSSADSVERSAK
jgi:hypothetical protein